MSGQGTGVLRIKQVTKFKKIWKDRGSGCELDLTVWRPVVEGKGYYIIGDFARPYHADDVRAEDLKNYPVYAVAEKNPLFPEFLRPPVDWQFIWNEEGTRCKAPCTIWQPVPPPGFVGLGCVFTPNHNKPPLELVRCVHHSVVLPGMFGENSLVWKDKGSGGNLDCALFSWSATPDHQADSIFPGSFIAIGHYAPPTTPVYCINKQSIISDNSVSSSSGGIDFSQLSTAVQTGGTCPRCDGTGAMGTFGPCTLSDLHFTHPCPTCEGKGSVDKAMVVCVQCGGLGGLGPFGKCDQNSLHYKPCHSCKARGYTIQS